MGQTFLTSQTPPKFAFGLGFFTASTFELSGRQRQDARPGLAKMYRVPPGRAWWPAVGAPLERGVRLHSTMMGSRTRYSADLETAPSNFTEFSR